MSGGHFDYAQHQIDGIVESIEQAIQDNSSDDEHVSRNYSKKTISEFKKGLLFLRKAKIYAQRIDYLLSYDDGEETFHKRLSEELLSLTNH